MRIKHGNELKHGNAFRLSLDYLFKESPVANETHISSHFEQRSRKDIAFLNPASEGFSVRQRSTVWNSASGPSLPPVDFDVVFFTRLQTTDISQNSLLSNAVCTGAQTLHPFKFLF